MTILHMLPKENSERSNDMLRTIKKYMIPILLSCILLVLFQPVYCQDPEINYFLIWILAGLPFGINRTRLWMVPGKMDLSGSAGLLVLNLIIAGLIGGFVAIWYLLEMMVKITCQLVGYAFRFLKIYA